MLVQLLRLIADGGVSTLEDLARRLSTGRPLLEAMLGELVRLGYLRTVASGCAGQCAGCPMGGCSVASQGRVWALTDRYGRAAFRGVAGTEQTAWDDGALGCTGRVSGRSDHAPGANSRLRPPLRTAPPTTTRQNTPTAGSGEWPPNL